MFLDISNEGSPYGCYPSESTRSPGHGWRFPPPSMNYRDSMRFRPVFEDAIPAANRGMYLLLNKCSSTWDFLFAPFLSYGTSILF